MENRELVLNRIFAAVVAEAERAAAEGIASPQEIDDAMRMGALFKRTPFAYKEDVGAETMRARLADFAERYGDRFKV
jgi:3-hydroxyacyl-CoA dehydrogenase